MNEFENNNKINVLMFGTILLILMMMDVVTTAIALKSNFVHEANGFMAPIINNTYALIFIKLLGTALITYLMYKVIQKNISAAKIGMGIILSFYGFVLLNNIYWIMRYQ